MSIHSVNLAALIGSRICHDLISPVGGITNGLEFLAMSGIDDSPELDIVSESAVNASARIRLFRLAFGIADAEQMVRSEECRSILADVYGEMKQQVDWQVGDAQPRPLVQAALLAVLCAEKLIPFGGHIAVDIVANRCSITVSADRLKHRPDLWAILDGAGRPHQVTPAEVQFLLLPMVLEGQNRTCQSTVGGTGATLTF